MSVSAFEGLVKEFGAALGMPNLAPAQATGLCQLVFDGKHVMQLIHVAARGQVLLSCEMGDTPCGPQQAALMAQANFMQAGGGAVLCQGSNGRAYVQMAIPLAECTASTMLAVSEALLDQADAWARKLNQDSAPPARTPAFFLQSV